MASPHLDSAIYAKDLRKSFVSKTATVEAVRGVDLDVHPGEIFAFLGPNGAGKTTVLRMLTTLLPIDSGEARVAGFDVTRQPKLVRKNAGYVGQRGGADPAATGLENLLLQGQLFGMSRSAATQRAEELMATFDLAEFAGRMTRTYSGGQRRRLELALGVTNHPTVLFLDEPTLGLDLQNRANLWSLLRALREAGTTIFFTTHYLEEADALSDRVAIIDHGQIVAEGTPQALKQGIAGSAIVIELTPDPGNIEALFAELANQPYVHDAQRDGQQIRLYVTGGQQALPSMVDLLRDRNAPFAEISLSEPSLDDVFLQQTGRALRDAGTPSQEAFA